MPDQQVTAIAPPTKTEDIEQQRRAAELERALGMDRRSRWRKRIIRLIILIAVVSLGYFAWVDWQKKQALKDKPSFHTETITRSSLTRTITATGTLQPTTKVEVGSEVSGRIESVDVTWNDPVKKGQILAQIRTDDIKARVKQMEASLLLAKADEQRAQATVREAQSAAERAMRLAQQRNISREELERAEAELARAKASIGSAEAQVAVAKANLEVEKANLLKATIRSPIDGMVLARRIEPGQTVAAAFQTPILFLLARDLKKMQLIVDVDEADVGEVKEGQEAWFRVDAFPDKRFPAKVLTVRNDPQVVQDVVTYEAVLEVDNSELLLRPGLTATAEIVSARVSETTLVPNAALRFVPEDSEDKEPEEDVVWILKDEKLVSLKLDLGITDGRSTVVKSDNLKPGMKVVTHRIEEKDKKK